ncbi:MAG TPA: hypothetical protein VMW10_12750 [Alphaproteobacteria bacterium]|nr:hypothetical protein [Alphaproteobacteria bacterium]
MIYKDCIDASLDCVKACDRFAFEGFNPSEAHVHGHEWAVSCSEVCNVVGRQTARGLCSSDLYEVCANYCDETAKKCDKINHEHAKICASSARKCADACRECKKDCEKQETEKRD